MLFGQGQVLDGSGKLSAPKFQELINPDPSHWPGPPDEKNHEITEHAVTQPLGLQPEGTPVDRVGLESLTDHVRAGAESSGLQFALNILHQHINGVKVPDLIDGRVLL